MPTEFNRSVSHSEFVSVRSQRELLAATEPNGYADAALRDGWDLPGRVLLTVVGGRIAYQAATSEATLQ